MLQLVRELAGDHHLVLAHAEELVEVLELDRARRLAVAAGRARPERLVGDHGADQCRQLRLGVARDDQVAVREQMMLEAVVDHLQRQGLSGQVGRTRVLAAAALGAGERVEAFLPGQVARVAHAGVHLRLVLGFHELVEVDRWHAVARAAASEVERRQRGDDVEVLAERQDDEERQHDDHLGPVEEPVADLERRLRQPAHRAGDPTARERPGALVRDLRKALGEEREAEAVEREVGHHDREDQPEHEHRLAVALEARRPGHEAAMERIEHGGGDGDLDAVLERRERAAERLRKRRALVEADRDQMELAQQQREKADEDHGVHHARPPVAQDHAPLEQPVDDDAAQPLERRVPARLGPKRAHDPELSPGERGEPRECEQQQRADPGWAHRGPLSSGRAA